MNNRLKAIRIQLNLSQEEFGSRIGIKSRAHISSLENGSRNITDRIIKDLVSVYNVNEEWLRTGNKDLKPFNESETFSLDEFAQKRNMSDIDLKIIKAYLELDPDVRKVILSTFKNALSDDKEEVKEKVNHVIGFIEPNANYTKEDDDTKNLSTLKVAEEVKEYSSKKLSAEEREEEYIKNVLKSAPKQVVSASSGTEDINKVV